MTCSLPPSLSSPPPRGVLLVPSPRIRVVRSSPRGIPERLVRLGDALERRRRVPPLRLPEPGPLIRMPPSPPPCGTRFESRARPRPRTRRARDTARPRLSPSPSPFPSPETTRVRVFVRARRARRPSSRRRAPRSTAPPRNAARRSAKAPSRFPRASLTSARSLLASTSDGCMAMHSSRSASTSARVRDASFASSTAPYLTRSSRRDARRRRRSARWFGYGSPSLARARIRARTRSAPSTRPGSALSAPSAPSGAAHVQAAGGLRTGESQRSVEGARGGFGSTVVRRGVAERRQLAETL